jgi:16S rRNA (guanine966-N2)-methyltransferase
VIRVTAGSLRGRRIPVPRDLTRPTSERARQAFFNIAGERIHDARFLDLFSGSGIFAFEAVSRGAKEAVAVDDSRPNTRAIETLARELHVPIRTVTADALDGIKRLGGEVFDVTYADPPYSYARYDDLLMAIDNSAAFAAGGLVAIEHRRRTAPFEAPLTRLQFLRRAEYGEVWITFFEVP